MTEHFKRFKNLGKKRNVEPLFMTQEIEICPINIMKYLMGQSFDLPANQTTFLF